jgi:hypothetical protein
VRKDGQDVMWRPAAPPASINVHGPWQIAAIGSGMLVTTGPDGGGFTGFCIAVTDRLRRAARRRRTAGAWRRYRRIDTPGSQPHAAR